MGEAREWYVIESQFGGFYQYQCGIRSRGSGHDSKNHGWRNFLEQQESGTRELLGHISFLPGDKSTGTIVGFGTILHTTNGGDT